MSNIDTSEPAFPTHRGLTQGMTLRDYFAAKAMQAMADKQMNAGIGDDRLNADVLAKVAYGMADAMLKAREQ